MRQRGTMSTEYERPDPLRFPEAPDHPDARVLALGLRQVQALFSRWKWMIDDGGALSIFLMFHFDWSYMRITAVGDTWDIAVYSVEAECNEDWLWVLEQWNDGEQWRVAVTPVDDGEVPFYLRAVVDRASIHHIGKVVCEGIENALIWRGKIEVWARH